MTKSRDKVGKFILEDLKINSRDYDENYIKRRAFVAKFMADNNLKYDTTSTTNLVLEALQNQGGQEWKDLIKEEERIYKRGCKIRLDLFGREFDPCHNLPCAINCLEHGVDKCRLLKRNKRLKKYFN